jgi:hypothetical protein
MPSKTFKLKILIIILFFVLFSANDIAYACKCKTPEISEALSGFAIVFEGRVESVWPKLVPSVHFEHDSIQQTYKFRVFRLWKGVIEGDSVVLFTKGTNCDSHFYVGETYLVFADKDHYFPKRLYSTICNRTVESRDAIEDIAFLGQGRNIAAPSIPFIPETNFHRLVRHIWIYFLTGIMLLEEFPIFESVADPVFVLYPLLLLHFVFLIVLWIAIKKTTNRKFPPVLVFFFICFLCSVAGAFFLRQSPHVGFCLNILFSLLLSFYYFIKANFKPALLFLFISVCFFLLGLFTLAFIFLSNSFTKWWFGYLFA